MIIINTAYEIFCSSSFLFLSTRICKYKYFLCKFKLIGRNKIGNNNVEEDECVL